MADWDITRYYADPSALATKLGVDPNDNTMLSVLYRVTQRFIGDAGRSLHRVDDDEFFATGDGGTIITVPGVPVIGDPVVTIDGVPAIGYRVGRRTGMFQRPGGWPQGLETVHITYSHGYAEIPADVQDVVFDAAEAAIYYQAGVESVGTGNETVRFAADLVKGGSTARWGDVVARYRLDDNGDGA